MENITLGTVANVIILISAVIIAVKNIYAFIKKPVDSVTAKTRAEEEKRIEDVLKREVPLLLQENCKVIIGAIEELKQMTLSQEETLEGLSSSIDLLNQSQLDMMRYNMNKIYYKYRPYKKILSADKKAFIKIYNDYKPMGGNSWIDALHQEVVEWPIVEDESELIEKTET